MRIEGASQTGVTEQQKALKKACSDLEGVFLGYLLKSMRKTVTKTDLFGSGREEEFFRDMLDSEVCSTASRTQPMGIADMLYRQLSQQLGPEAEGVGAKHLQRGAAESSTAQAANASPLPER